MKKILVSHLVDLHPRIGRKVVVGDEEIAVFRLSDDEIRAISNVCPHRQGPLVDGTVMGHTVTCPLHSSRFDLDDGEILYTPDNQSGCVKTYPTQIEDGNVYVFLEE